MSLLSVPLENYPTLTGQLLPQSETTIIRCLLEYFQENLTAVRQQLHNEAISKLRIPADLWILPNGKAFLAVVSHWVDRDFHLRARLIAVRLVNGQHTAENFQNHFHSAVIKFGLERMLGCSVSI